MPEKSISKLAFYGSIASIIGLFLAIGVLWFGSFQARKALSIQVISIGTWFTGPLASDFRLTYRDEPVQNVASVLLQIRNTGKQPITTSDFEKPLRILIKGTSKIVSVEQVGSEPSNLKLNLEWEGREVNVGPTLFNPGDMANVSITAFCTEIPKIAAELTVARIAGIKKVDFETTLKPKDTNFTFKLFREMIFLLLTVTFGSAFMIMIENMLWWFKKTKKNISQQKSSGDSEKTHT